MSASARQNPTRRPGEERTRGVPYTFRARLGLTLVVSMNSLSRWRDSILSRQNESTWRTVSFLRVSPVSRTIGPKDETLPVPPTCHHELMLTPDVGADVYNRRCL